MQTASDVFGGCAPSTYDTRRFHEGRPVVDRDGFERMVLPLLHALKLAALRLTKSRSAADDLVQETVLRAWRFWPRYVERDTCRAWLQRILTNTFRSEHRRLARVRAQLAEFEVNLHASEPQVEAPALHDAATTPHDFDAREHNGHGLDDRLTSALAALSADQRRVLWLIDVRERSYRDAAAELGCPIGTVMSRLHRARAALRLHLQAA